MKTRPPMIILENMSYNQIEAQIIEAIIDSYIKKNGKEYYLIIDLMKIKKPEFSNLVKNALLLIIALFFVERSFVCDSEMRNISPEQKKLLEAICIIE